MGGRITHLRLLFLSTSGWLGASALRCSVLGHIGATRSELDRDRDRIEATFNGSFGGAECRVPVDSGKLGFGILLLGVLSYEQLKTTLLSRTPWRSSWD